MKAFPNKSLLRALCSMMGTFFSNMNPLIYCSMDLFADLEGRKEIYREDVLDIWDGLLNLEEIQQVCYPL